MDAARRRNLEALALGGATAALGGRVSMAGATNAPDDWERYSSPGEAGYRPGDIATVEHMLFAMTTTSLMVVRHGKIAYAYGNIGEVSYLASARKSVLSMLYGKYVASGAIDLDRTLASIGIEEGGEGLTEVEKTATVRHLLTSSSGVYFPAGSPGSAPNTPRRGSARPGERFYYNNWDFNVAGAVFERLTGKPVLAALEEDLARPLGFQDFDPSRQRMMGYQSDPSRFKAYHMFLSARDMARLGLVMLNRGRWQGRQMIPAAWIRESTREHVPASAMSSWFGNSYGYLWWIPARTRSSPAWKDSYFAAGNYGQYILVLPEEDTVIVHRRALTDEFAIARNLGVTQVNPPGVAQNAFLELAERVVAARTS